MPRHPLLPVRQKPESRGRLGALIAAIVIVAALVLLCGAWAALAIEQRTMRTKAEALLADMQRIQVGSSSSAEAQTLVTKWFHLGQVETNCTPDGCTSFMRLTHTLPRVLSGDSNPTANNLLARMAGGLGLRNAAVGGGLQYKNGVVAGKAFSVELTLPLNEWFARGAFVPDLAVFSNETQAFTETELTHVVPTHPYRVVRRIKGPYGLMISYMPQEPAAEKTKYMDFRLSCITQFSPCHQESEILPAASELVNQVF